MRAWGPLRQSVALNGAKTHTKCELEDASRPGTAGETGRLPRTARGCPCGCVRRVLWYLFDCKLCVAELGALKSILQVAIMSSELNF